VNRFDEWKQLLTQKYAAKTFYWISPEGCCVCPARVGCAVDRGQSTCEETFLEWANKEAE